MTDDELIRCFEAAEAPPGGFPHVEHVRVAWYYLCRHPLPAALERFRTGLRGFAEARGAAGRYHETITTAYVLLIAERLDEIGRDAPWTAFAARCPELLRWRPSILDRYYSPGTLASERARRVFLMPDRVPPEAPLPKLNSGG